MALEFFQLPPDGKSDVQRFTKHLWRALYDMLQIRFFADQLIISTKHEVTTSVLNKKILTFDAMNY